MSDEFFNLRRKTILKSQTVETIDTVKELTGLKDLNKDIT